MKQRLLCTPFPHIDTINEGRPTSVLSYQLVLQCKLSLLSSKQAHDTAPEMPNGDATKLTNVHYKKILKNQLFHFSQSLERH